MVSTSACETLVGTYNNKKATRKMANILKKVGVKNMKISRYELVSSKIMFIWVFLVGFHVAMQKSLIKIYDFTFKTLPVKVMPFYCLPNYRTTRTCNTQQSYQSRVTRLCFQFFYITFSTKMPYPIGNFQSSLTNCLLYEMS